MLGHAHRVVGLNAGFGAGLLLHDLTAMRDPAQSTFPLSWAQVKLSIASR